MQAEGKTHVVSTRMCRRAFFGILMLSLVVTLATRTVHLPSLHTIFVKASRAQAVRQHLDRDAVPWAPPVPVFTTLQPPVFYPYIAPAGTLATILPLDESLYNRPPPLGQGELFAAKSL